MITDNGISYVYDKDRVVTATGTTETDAGSTYNLYESGKEPYLRAGVYELSGCPEGGSDSTYYIQYGDSKDYGDGVKIILEDSGKAAVSIHIGDGVAGYKADDLKFTPTLKLIGLLKSVKSVSEISQSAKETAEKANADLVAIQTEEGVLKLLSDNSQGVFTDENGHLYIDATYINTGSMSAERIKTGSLTSDNYKYTSGSFSDSGSTIQLSDGSIQTPYFYSSDSGASFKGDLNAATGTFKGELSAATGTFKGQLNAATGTFKGELSAATGSFAGKLTSGEIEASSISVLSERTDNKDLRLQSVWSNASGTSYQHEYDSSLPYRGFSLDVTHPESSSSVYSSSLLLLPRKVILQTGGSDTVEITSGKLTHNGTAVSESGHTHSYLPLSGGTTTGNVHIAVNQDCGTSGLTKPCINLWGTVGHLDLISPTGTPGIYFQKGNGTKTTTAYYSVLRDNTASRSENIYVNMPASGGTILCSSSDIRLKDNIADTEVQALPLIDKIKVRQFDWTAQKEGHQDIGFIADELEKLDPKLAIGGGYDDEGNMDVKCVDSFYLLGYAVKAIQELSAKVEKLESQLKGE